MTGLPIEGAPKDGTGFLMWCEISDVWRWIVGRYKPNGVLVSVPGGWTYPAKIWCPLPDPPSETEHKEYLSVDAEERAESAVSYREGDLDKFFGCAPDAKYPEDTDRETETEHRCVTCGLTIVAYRNLHLCAECEESRGR